MLTTGACYLLHSTASVATIVVLALVIAAGAITTCVFLVLAVVSPTPRRTDDSSKPDSAYAKYRYAAVTTNSEVCSDIGL